jgi:hypothetical protein
MKPKTKPESRIQIKLSMPKSLGEACETARKRADKTPYDWNATMVEAVEKANTEFSQFLDLHEANGQPKAGLTTSPTNGADPDRS